MGDENWRAKTFLSQVRHVDGQPRTMRRRPALPTLVARLLLPAPG
jgi:hypothetical protein